VLIYRRTCEKNLEVLSSIDRSSSRASHIQGSPASQDTTTRTTHQVAAENPPADRAACDRKLLQARQGWRHAAGELVRDGACRLADAPSSNCMSLNCALVPLMHVYASADTSAAVCVLLSCVNRNALKCNTAECSTTPSLFASIAGSLACSGQRWQRSLCE